MIYRAILLAAPVTAIIFNTIMLALTGGQHFLSGLLLGVTSGLIMILVIWYVESLSHNMPVMPPLGDSDPKQPEE